jgi:predicted metalloprotease with PDZ domain
MIRTLATAFLSATLIVPAALAEQPNTPLRQVVETPSAAGRSYLGVDIRNVTPDRVSALKLKDEHGVEITMVDGDAPAGKAGLKEHDVIVEFNGTAVESEEQLRRLIREVPPGHTVAMSVVRDGNPINVSVQLADHDAMVAKTYPRILVPSIRIPDFPRNGMDVPFEITTYSSALGVQTESLTRQLGEYFGVKDGEGVLIRSVEKGSAGEKAGLKAGDVIVRADNERLTDRSDLSHALRSHRTGGKMMLQVMRDKKEQTINVTLPDRGSRDSSMIELDTDGLLASLQGLQSLNTDGLAESLESLQGLSVDLPEIDLSSLADSLTALSDLDLQDLQSLQSLPDTENVLEHSKELLQGLKIGSGPI